MIRGPQEYVPSVELEVVTRQKAIPLDENEGIYVRDIKTGKVGLSHFKHTMYMYMVYKCIFYFGDGINIWGRF